MKIEREHVRHPDASMRWLQLRQASFRGALHRHGHAELTWIERGHGLRWVGSRVEPFADGDLVLLGAELPHLWLTAEGGAPRTCAATVLQFPVDWPAATGLPELRGLQVVVARSARGLSIEGTTAQRLRPLLAAIGPAGAARRVAVLIELLATLAEAAQQRPAELRAISPAWAAEAEGAAGLARRQQRLERLLRWIQAHLADEIHVAEAAALVGVSPAAFARFFRREAGQGFIDFVNDARCSWAAQRLVQGREPIADIAHGCGFPTLSNFGEQFRRRYGVSPRAYRRSALAA